METIITVQGNVKYNITLDPTVWIFDDRKIDLNTYFNEARIEIDEDEKYLNSMGKHWSREIMEGATFPPTLKTEKKFDRKKMVTGTFGILLKPFLKNAVPGKMRRQSLSLHLPITKKRFRFPKLKISSLSSA